MSKQPNTTSDITSITQETTLVNLALKRLRRRGELRRTAREILAGISDVADDISEWLVGEQDIMDGGCNDANKKLPVMHNCAIFECKASSEDGFNCGLQTTNFTCVGLSIYSECVKKVDNQFVCGTASSPFSCNDYDVYSCQVFSCGEKEKEKDFDCQAKLDFGCVDLYMCDFGFDCKSDHIFLCSDDHQCSDVFNCAAGSVTKCNKDSPFNCTEEFKYNNPFGPNPGDFACGLGPTDPDDFTCASVFACDGLDDFHCDTMVKFSCGDSAGSDSFSCNQSPPHAFYCDTGTFGGPWYTCGTGVTGFESHTPTPK